MKKILALLLCACMLAGLLSGCNLAEEDPYTPTGDALEWDDSSGPVSTEPQEDSTQELTLTYYPNVTLNPFFCTDYTNKALQSLLYQGLFTVDSKYNVEPVLCSHYYVSDTMTTYTFFLDENATFSDGSRVTPEDVHASLISAISSKIYSGRFYRVLNVAVTDDGGITVDLNTAYEDFPLLLDIPIIKKDQQTDSRPLGTGPYKFTETAGVTQLTRRTDWWCSAKNMTITAPVIELLEAEDPYHIRDEFQFGDLDLVQAEPGSDKYVEYRCDYELWNSETGIFMYLVTHKDSYVFSTPELRAALTYAIDRTTLAKTHYRGFAEPATLPASPQFPYYNQTLAAKYEYDPQRFAQLISQNGMTGWEVTLVVCREDTLRLKVAKSIAAMLEDAGLVVRINDYDAENIEYALVATDYDLYLGQTALSPNMDLSEFFDDDGNLSYAGLSDPNMYALCLQALENHGNYYTLHYNVMNEGRLCPLMFRSYAVYATRGMLTDLTPSRNNVFYYSIGKSMENARIES